MNLQQYSNVPDYLIFDSLCKADSVINKKSFRRTSASISGGSDSDIVLDLCQRVDIGNRIHYHWFDTGLEYEATMEHLLYLEARYGIQIARLKAHLPIPACRHRFGQPFISKQVSKNIECLQRNNFQWEDAPYEYLVTKYPECTSSIKWWCNMYTGPDFSSHSIFSIGRNKGLKEFLIRHPPNFMVSAKCCQYAKKATAAQFDRKYATDLSITGVRKAEGGVRSAVYTNCFSMKTQSKIYEYRPVFWYSDQAKQAYSDYFGIVHSRCYTEYGMTRTGCAGCPFNRHVIEELPVIQYYEPKMYHAITNIFADSYRYTKMYRDFIEDYFPNKRIREPKKQVPVSILLFRYLYTIFICNAL